MYRDKLALAAAKPVSEFEVHSDCYQYLKGIYPLVRGEVKIEIPRKKDSNGRTIRLSKNTKVPRERGARYDLVVYNSSHDPLFTIEVKRNEKHSHSKQEHYELLAGVPNYLVGSITQLQALVHDLTTVAES